MKSTDILKARVPPEIRRYVKEKADREFLSEAAWLKRLVLLDLRASAVSSQPTALRASEAKIDTHISQGRCGKPILVRLRIEDRLLLDARAEARGMKPATYASILLRSHLRQLTPLPKDELLVLKRSIAELASIGRNVNQMAKVANDSGRLPTSVRDEFRAILKVCEALRGNTKTLLKSNVSSWRSGHAESER